jgi:hypothetical protein
VPWPPRFCSTCIHFEQRRWHPEVIIEAIRRFAAEHGRPPLSSECLPPIREWDGYPSAQTVQAAFGTWAAAIEAAGFPRPYVGHKVVRHELACQECGQSFTSTISTARYCSHRCGMRHRRRARREESPAA